MRTLLPLSVQFRHVVVPGAVRWRRRSARMGELRPLGDGSMSETPAATDEELSFCRWLFVKAGLKPNAYRTETLKRRIPACLRALRVRRVSEARQAIEENPALVHTAASALLVGVTSFFRDRHVFQLLESELPELVAQRHGLHVWSAGCSDGHELYSVALLLARAGFLDRSYLLGTDCRKDAVERAKLGVYPAEELKSVAPDLVDRYFSRKGGEFHLSQRLMVATRFRIADLLSGNEPGLWDLILCRNMSMYMNAAATAGLWERFESALRVGGLLVLGKAERPHGAQRLTPIAPCVYRRARG